MFHNLPRHGHSSCSLGGSLNKSESLHLDTRCVAGGTLKVKMILAFATWLSQKLPDQNAVCFTLLV